MRQMESQIQQLLERTGEEAEKKAAKEVERQVAAHVDAAMEKLKVGECLDIRAGHVLIPTVIHHELSDPMIDL